MEILTSKHLVTGLTFPEQNFTACYCRSSHLGLLKHFDWLRKPGYKCFIEICYFPPKSIKLTDSNGNDDSDTHSPNNQL